jgi:hypothetical protein
MQDQTQGLSPVAAPGTKRALFRRVRKLFFEIAEEVLAQRIVDEGGDHQSRDAG